MNWLWCRNHPTGKERKTMQWLLQHPRMQKELLTSVSSLHILVITSYSIHYTKLYEAAWMSWPLQQVATICDGLWEREPPIGLRMSAHNRQVPQVWQTETMCSDSWIRQQRPLLYVEAIFCRQSFRFHPGPYILFHGDSPWQSTKCSNRESYNFV